jgi:hypothetical protein
MRTVPMAKMDEPCTPPLMSAKPGTDWSATICSSIALVPASAPSWACATRAALRALRTVVELDEDDLAAATGAVRADLCVVAQLTARRGATRGRSHTQPATPTTRLR